MTAKKLWLAFVLMPGAVLAHSDRLWIPQPLDWSTDQIEQVIAFSGRTVSVNGKTCLAGSTFLFRVRDQYAFDIDETVSLQLELRRASPNDRVLLDYDGLISPGWNTGKELPPRQNGEQQWQKLSIPLQHARFANLGFMRSDFLLSSNASQGVKAPEFTICSLSLKRSHRTPVHKAFGTVAIEIVDETGHEVPARLGLYDSQGRLPLPNEQAVTVQDLAGTTRVLRLGNASMWPVKNRSVFYTSGRYRARLPVGDYELIVARGPEYRLARQRIAIRAEETRKVGIKLQRWTDMAAQHWYSGEDHIHHPRQSAEDDRSLALFAQAEDIRVSNVMQMGNVAHTYFHQRDWQPVVVDDRSSYVLVPGQEDPRTSHRGHTLHLNIRKPLRDPARYLLYHELFEQVRAQGGLAGYAHVLERGNGEAALKGMAIDMPFALIDFAEIMTGATWGSEIWFDFLNLGYKLVPSAGSDYPYVDLPGAVRNYVRINGPFTAQRWFDSFKQGHLFVTSGPMLELTINGQPIGSEIRVKSGERLSIKTMASINPDVDLLSTLELVEQGESVKTVASERGAAQLELSEELSTSHGTWFVARARGRNPAVVAHSAPIYVVVDGQSFWKPAAVPAIVARLRAGMQKLLEPRVPEGTESWETQEADIEHWDAQQGALKQRIGQANAVYDELIKRAAPIWNTPPER